MRLAVIGTFHQRRENTLPLLRRVLVESTRRPDEFFCMVEDDDDAQAALDALDVLGMKNGYTGPVVALPTPRNEDGSYSVIPYSNKINWALRMTDCDIITYLDNSSMPSVDKYKIMAYEMACHPEWGGCYVTQQRTGFAPATFEANKVMPSGHGQLNYTAICHKLTADRWPLDMRWANPDLADAMFMDALAKSVGPLHPVGGPTVHDFHHIASPAAAGL